MAAWRGKHARAVPPCIHLRTPVHHRILHKRNVLLLVSNSTPTSFLYKIFFSLSTIALICNDETGVHCVYLLSLVSSRPKSKERVFILTGQHHIWTNMVPRKTANESTSPYIQGMTVHQCLNFRRVEVELLPPPYACSYRFLFPTAALFILE